MVTWVDFLPTPFLHFFCPQMPVSRPSAYHLVHFRVQILFPPSQEGESLILLFSALLMKGTRVQELLVSSPQPHLITALRGVRHG